LYIETLGLTNKDTSVKENFVRIKHLWCTLSWTCYKTSERSHKRQTTVGTRADTWFI